MSTNNRDTTRSASVRWRQRGESRPHIDAVGALYFAESLIKDVIVGRPGAEGELTRALAMLVTFHRAVAVSDDSRLVERTQELINHFLEPIPEGLPRVVNGIEKIKNVLLDHRVPNLPRRPSPATDLPNDQPSETI